ncbi:MAG: C39 family peptidase [Gemmataceae bacterium]
MKSRLTRYAVLATILWVVVQKAAHTQAPSCGANYASMQTATVLLPLPDIAQPDEYSCGTASLLSILSYYGLERDDYRTLKHALGTNRKNGTDYQRMVSYARHHGFKVDVIPEMSLAKLDECLTAKKPVICSIQAYDEDSPKSQLPTIYANQNRNGHFVVAIGFDAANYYFMDPCLAGRRGFVPRGDFDARWHDDEGTKSKPDVIHHLGLVIWKSDATPIDPHCARRID